MLKKSIYEAPEAELLVVRFEGNFCQTFTPGAAGGDDVIVDDEDDLD
jgi:hypothetical protein